MDTVILEPYVSQNYINIKTIHITQITKLLATEPCYIYVYKIINTVKKRINMENIIYYKMNDKEQVCINIYSEKNQYMLIIDDHKSNRELSIYLKNIYTIIDKFHP